tara:strand:- start:1542 stop:2831 length:1290 start_codon:yes stop_codon:yes gene_type:complete
MKKYYELGKKILFPITRSLTGNGVRKTLNIIKKEFPKLKIKKIKSGTKVFDWRVPEEWNISDAYIIDKYGDKIINFKESNLHVVGYSVPVNRIIKKKELLKNLHSLKNQPNAIPYITSYYNKSWGFCLTYNQLKKINKNYSDKDSFKVVINSKLKKKGILNYGELIIKGKSTQEILVSTYICHPSMANNELSGPIVSMGLINHFQKTKNLKKTLRFLFIPETIGSISYLSKNLKVLKKKVIGGYNLSCIGDERGHSCMFSKYSNSLSDEAIIQAYKNLKIKNYKVYSFLERGSDERQYNSPGIDLPIASIFRTKYGKYPEYHTSLDNFKLVTLMGVKGGFKVAKEAIEIIQKNIYPKATILCEPQMGKRGLYPTLSTKQKKTSSKAYLSFLQYSDGKNSINKISKLIMLNLNLTKKIYKKLLDHKMITY